MSNEVVSLEVSGASMVSDADRWLVATVRSFSCTAQSGGRRDVRARLADGL